MQLVPLFLVNLGGEASPQCWEPPGLYPVVLYVLSVCSRPGTVSLLPHFSHLQKVDWFDGSHDNVLGQLGEPICYVLFCFVMLAVKLSTSQLEMVTIYQLPFCCDRDPGGQFGCLISPCNKVLSPENELGDEAMMLV